MPYPKPKNNWRTMRLYYLSVLILSLIAVLNEMIFESDEFNRLVLLGLAFVVWCSSLFFHLITNILFQRTPKHPTINKLIYKTTFTLSIIQPLCIILIVLEANLS